MAIDMRGVPHGMGDHDHVYDHSTVLACPGCEDGEIRSSSHDCFAPREDEDWDMDFSTHIGVADLARLRDGVTECPTPSEPRCTCAVHEQLRTSSKWLPSTRIPDRPGALAPERSSVVVRLTDEGLPEFARGS